LSVFVLGADNSIIKGKIVLREQGEFAFPQPLQRLKESKYQKILSRANPGPSSKGELVERKTFQIK
jgi:hypothetical protein